MKINLISGTSRRAARNTCDLCESIKALSCAKYSRSREKWPSITREKERMNACLYTYIIPMCVHVYTKGSRLDKSLAKLRFFPPRQSDYIAERETAERARARCVCIYIGSLEKLSMIR